VHYLVSEALTNAAKHAGAREVRVRVERRGPLLHAEVADDGAGGARADGGSGLRGLQDRIRRARRPARGRQRTRRRDAPARLDPARAVARRARAVH
jgi:nitrate/nitrite-specific signal transduction histidine kinase